MRLWHYKLIPYLPDSQVRAQWRELNTIYRKQPRHILINYIYDYDKVFLRDYSTLVIQEMFKRGFRINDFGNYANYFKTTGWCINSGRTYDEHDNDYLRQCFYNLQEKYYRGQKDFTHDCYDRLLQFYMNANW